MSLGVAFRDAWRTYIARSNELLPFYVLGTAIPVIARTLPIIGLGIGYILLRQAGGLQEVETVLADVDPIPIDQPEAGQLTAETQRELMQIVSGPEVLFPLGVTVVGMIILVVILNAAVAAGQLHGAFGSLESRRGVAAAVDGTFMHTWTFLGLLVLETVVYLLLSGIIAAGVGILAIFSNLIAGVAGIGGVLVLLILVPVLRLVFAFARAAAVVDRVGISGAITGAIGYTVDNPGTVLGYGLLWVGIFAGLGVIAGILSAIGAGIVGGIILLLVVTPLLDLTKVGLYGGPMVGDTPALPDSIGGYIFTGLAEGWKELIGFIKEQRRLVVLSAGIFIAAVYVGWTLSTVLEGNFTASIEQRIAEMTPVGEFFRYAGNNWQVAVAQVYAGLGLGLPAAVSLAFNGMFFGMLFRLEVAPAILIAFVVPHGIIEIPGLIISGALGLYLGKISWRYASGQTGREELAIAISRAYRIAIGFVIVFVAAAAIEALISPYYWQLMGLSLI